VASGKSRGFIVDYIGLANHLSEALAIYSHEEPHDIQEGLKNLLTELPVLEERYRRLIQHFQTAGVAKIEAFVSGDLKTPEEEVTVIHAAVSAMADFKRRADFEVFLRRSSRA
jgi:type I restriction enzyme R subunit